MELYTTHQIRQLEQKILEEGTSGESLMESAGKAILETILKEWPDAKSVMVMCGFGNNAGDGYVFARLAKKKGLKVQVRYIGDFCALKDYAQDAMEKCKRSKIKIEHFHLGEPLEADVIVDALFGIGLQGGIQGEASDAVQSINQSHASVLSIDIPSGLIADTGEVASIAVHADHTATFFGVKQGMLTGQGLDYCGSITCHDLNVASEHILSIPSSAQTLSLEDYKEWLIPRNRSTHKGSLGHVLVIGGNEGMAGAPIISGLGALRVGAGLVTIGMNTETVDHCNVPELMCRGIEKPKELDPLLAKANVIALGPGLGQTKWSQQLFEKVCESELPFVIDADALNLLAKNSMQRNNWILTPHPGEAGCLLNIFSREVQKNRFLTAQRIQEKFGGICVLKGSGTIIHSDHEKPYVCQYGNPGMATAGVGDLLTGVIAGLVAQGLPLSVAAKCGVVVHSLAGDLVAAEGERGLIATDLLPFIRMLVN